MKTFWVRQKNNIMMAFSYVKETTTKNMAQKYGGSLTTEVPPLPTEDQISGEIMSVLSNSSPEANDTTKVDGPYKVLVNNYGKWALDSSFQNVSEANTRAKEIIKFFHYVIVIKE